MPKRADRTAELETENAELRRQLAEAQAQQQALGQVLQVVNASPGDLMPVFDAILEKAHTLCGAVQGAMFLLDGEQLRAVATRGMPEAFNSRMRAGYRAADFPLTEPLLAGEPFNHVVDMALLDHPVARAAVELAGAHTVLAVALRKGGVLLGNIVAARREVRPFTDKQVALLQNFAAQAVIAIENARLLTETREALGQQTATAEVLQVINSSPGDLQPVFEATLDKALDLCGAAFGMLSVMEGDQSQTVATRGVPDAYVEFRRRNPAPATAPISARVAKGEPFIHTVDLKAEPSYMNGDPQRRALVDLGGARTSLVVPLTRDQVVLGAIHIYRTEVRPFSEKQIALLQNFAAQAVIAMENARLLTETREALEQQTATAEVLQVINASPGDLAPVFDAMLDKALRLCGAAFGILLTYDGERFHHGALHSIPAAYAEFMREHPPIYGPGTAPGQLASGERLVHVVDMTATESYRSGDPNRRAIADLAGARTLVAVPLRKDSTLLGAIVVFRQEVRPFGDRDIALLENFAAQAVIAMENARLITETREALEQQTATNEVLKAISRSAFDLNPILETALENAIRLCGATRGHVFTFDGEFLRFVAAAGAWPGFREALEMKPLRPGRGSIAGRAAAQRSIVQVEDVLAEPDYDQVELIKEQAFRTVLAVPMLREETLLGVIVILKSRVEPFTKRQIELVQTFADQAVIAVENTRLITETREALERQTATAEVLGVINSSPGDLAPVFDAVLEKATRLCESAFGSLLIYDGARFENTAVRNVPEAFAEFARPGQKISFGPGTGPYRLLAGEPFVHIVDGRDEEAYHRGDAAQRALIELAGARTWVVVPLRKDGRLFGAITVFRQEVRPFSEKQIALLQNFAAQAMIAMENARLLNELRERTDALAQSVDELKALSEVSQAVSSTLDLRAVLSTILNRSVELTGADAGVIFRYSRAQRSFRFVEAVGYDQTIAQRVRDVSVTEDVTALGEAMASRAPVQIPDLRERAGNPLRDAALAAGYRSVLIVPLVGANRIFGAIVLQRRTVGEFPEATVRLMQTLAVQSALAIQNARLFREIADKSEELRLASQHKSQFLANMSHELRTPLNAILGYAELLVDGIYGEVPARAMGVLERMQNNGRHLLALINDVLDLSKIEAGQLVLSLEDYAMPDVVQSVVSATEGLANSKGLKFTADVSPGLPTGRGDARRLAQVLLNLVGNAVKFTDQGEVAVRALTEDGNFVLTVRDTGPGIAPENHDKIFGEFQQVDNSNTRKKGGTGLGLAISKRMVEMQGGTITVDSALGKGATFRVTLPIRVEAMPDELAGELMGAA
jgi:GAF domain-containing protein